MARLILLWWVLLVSFQTLYQGLVYTYYVCNKAYIIEQLCENKSRPALNCNGRCHLKKVMQSSAQKAPVENESQPYLPTLEEVKLPTLFFQGITPLVVLFNSLCFQNKLKTGFDYQFFYAYEPSKAVWNPPRFI